MPGPGYTTVTLPITLISQIEQEIRKPTSTYVSIAEFCKEAIRNKLSEIRLSNRSDTSTRSKGVGVPGKPLAEPATVQPESDTPKSTTRKKRSRKAPAVQQAEPRKGSLDSFVDA